MQAMLTHFCDIQTEYEKQVVTYTIMALSFYSPQDTRTLILTIATDLRLSHFHSIVRSNTVIGCKRG